ncbi:MAG: hypothetical protein E6G07_13075 [Actinobacteria bacterium]|nr:MAG: hypothetical protein E6G07_13075 [Actinomycetota bacterium]
MKPRLVIPLALCAALAAAGCGSSKKSSSNNAATPPPSSAPSTTTTPAQKGGGGSKLQLAADASGQLLFDKTSLSGKAGKITLDMSNPAPVPHGIAVKGNGIQQKGPTVSQGSSSTVTVTLKPGKYEFYCPVDGHEAAGMKGTLTVK